MAAESPSFTNIVLSALWILDRAYLLRGLVRISVEVLLKGVDGR